jgi:hypothetical protein
MDDKTKNLLAASKFVLDQTDNPETGGRDSVNIRFSWLKQVLNKSINGKTIRINDDNKIEDIEL